MCYALPGRIHAQALFDLINGLGKSKKNARLAEHFITFL